MSHYQKRERIFDTGDVDCTFQRRWFGKHRGVTWEVRQAPVERFDDPDLCRDERRPTGYWWYYLHLVEPQFSKNVWSEVWIEPIPQDEPGYEGRVGYRLHDHLLANLGSWHGGLSYYWKRGGHDGAPREIVVGCDYDHLWDSGVGFCFSGVYRDACATIDELYEVIPDLRRRCPSTGEWCHEDEGFVRRDGEWLSRDGAVYMMEKNLQWPPPEAWREPSRRPGRGHSHRSRPRGL